MDALDPIHAIGLPLLGIALCVALLQGWLFRFRPKDRVHLWTAAWAIAVAGFIVGRYAQAVGSDALVPLALRLQYSTGLLLCTFGLSATRQIAGRPATRAAALLQALSLGFVALPWLGELVVTSRIVHRPDAFGVDHRVAAVTPIALLFLPAVVLFAIAALRQLRRHLQEAQRNRRLIAIATCVGVGLAATNDILFTQGVLTTVPLLEVALVAQLLGSVYVLVRASSQVWNDLEAAVAARTRELDNQRRELEHKSLELEAALRHLRHFLDGLPDPVCVFHDGRFRYVNPAALRYFGYEAAQLEGKRIDVLIHPSDLELARERFAGLASSAVSSPPVEQRFVRRDWQPVVGELVGMAVEFAGEPAAVAIIRDLTVRKELQARLQVADQLASVGTLAAGVGHEINNPLTYVLANLEMVRDELGRIAPAAAAGELREMLDEAHRGAEQVRQIVRDLKTFARSRDDDYGAIDLRQAMRLAINLARNEIRHRARLVTEIEDVPLVRASESRLAQVLVNLLVNAAQAITQGSVADNQVLVRVCRGEAGKVVIEVSDTGEGIDDELLRHAFDPFVTSKPVGIGTGLGLSVSYAIVQRFGGHLELESKVGKGTLARLTLLAAEGAPVDAPAPAPVSEARSGRILVIDDEPAVGRTLSRLLGQYEVTVVTSGEVAIGLAGELEFDVILCDVMMPGADGIAVYQAFAARGEADRIVFITGGTFTDRTAEFMRQNANPRLDKPISKESLLRVVAERLAAEPGRDRAVAPLA